MDLDGDGNTDVLSGSYSRHEPDMAGLFQVLWGTGKGQFAPAKVLEGSDGKPLLIAAGEEDMTDKICTRPTAADLDGDGHLDLVVGNFTGTFALFQGEGKGRFAPKHSWLTDGQQPLRVDAHGDPCLCDWDGDGDLDLLSGSAGGGVSLFVNAGSRQAPKFQTAVALVPVDEQQGERTFWGEGQLTGPHRDTRVGVGDLNGDGKLDLLVGDAVTICHPAAGLDEAAAKAKLADWDKQQDKLMQAMQQEGADQDKLQADYEKLIKDRARIVREDRTGFVWVYYRK